MYMGLVVGCSGAVVWEVVWFGLVWGPSEQSGTVLVVTILLRCWCASGCICELRTCILWALRGSLSVTKCMGLEDARFCLCKLCGIGNRGVWRLSLGVSGSGVSLRGE